MKKRLISILLCGLLAAACIGCGEKTYSISYNYAECKVEDVKDLMVFKKGDEVTINQNNDNIGNKNGSYKLKINYVKYLSNENVYLIEYEYTNINMDCGYLSINLKNITDDKNNSISINIRESNKNEESKGQGAEVVEDGETCVVRECFNVVNKDAESLKIYQPYTNDKNVYFEIEIDK